MEFDAIKIIVIATILLLAGYAISTGPPVVTSATARCVNGQIVDITFNGTNLQSAGRLNETTTTTISSGYYNTGQTTTINTPTSHLVYRDSPNGTSYDTSIGNNGFNQTDPNDYAFGFTQIDEAGNLIYLSYTVYLYETSPTKLVWYHPQTSTKIWVATNNGVSTPITVQPCQG